MNEFFKPAGDLVNDSVNKEKTNEFFKPAGDLEDAELKTINKYEEINKYLSSIVSGKEFGMECHLGTLCSSGKMFVTFGELEQMIDDGSYNIISAHCINPEMIDIYYEQYDPDLKFIK